MMYYRIRGKRVERPARLRSSAAAIAALLLFWPLAAWPPREAGGKGFAFTAAWIGGLILMTAVGGLIRRAARSNTSSNVRKAEEG